MTKTIATAMAAAALTLLAACNTVSGAGEDLQSASDEVNEEI